MKVYIIIERDYVGSSILKVFKNDEDANKWLFDNHNLDHSIEEHEVIE